MTDNRGPRLFVVMGIQRTGTNLLREILNTNEHIAMLGEVFTPNPTRAHWDNFVRLLPAEALPPTTYADARLLLDRYFDFIRDHWADGAKARSCAFGVDIKYNQLRRISPADQNLAGPPFLLQDLRSRGALLIHAVRENVLQCALSTMIADQRGVWHNYQGTTIDRTYYVDPEACLAYAREIVSERKAFSNFTKGSSMVTCCYEDLVKNIGRADAGGEIPPGPGPLLDIADALEVPFRFRYDGRLQKAVNVPYSRLVSNHEALLGAVKNSEFSAFAATLA
jgi:LPS sulfotransferase NodH